MTTMNPPIAPRRPVHRELHGESVIDDYAWLRDREDTETLAYLQSENEFTEESLAHLADLRTTIFEEIRSRVLEDDISAPAKRDDWWYASETAEGSQYPTLVRMKGAPDGERHVTLDVNALAEGHEYTQLGTYNVSPSHRYLMYSVDHDGSESYRLRIRDLETGLDLADTVDGTYYSTAWSADEEHIYYTTVDAAHRPHRVWRHQIGTDSSMDTIVMEEPDHRMFLSVGTTQDDRYLIISASSAETSSAWFLDADNPTGAFAEVLPRNEGVEYYVEHRDDAWLVVTDQDAPNGRLISIDVDTRHERELIGHDDLRRINGVLPLSNHLVVFGRSNGLRSIEIIDDSGERRPLSFDEEVYAVGGSSNLEFDTDVLRVAYQSMVTPARIIDIDLTTGERTLVKETPVLGGYDAAEYTSRREWAEAADGTPIPISIVHRADLDVSGPRPMLLYGYGSYEASMDPTFSSARLSLLDRGVIFAIAHVRGGGEMGRLWHRSGKMASKINTFTDFIACADHLIDAGYTEPSMLAARGGSAGGLLMGAVMNLRPELFKAIIAQVPFVDVINTMLDETLPLTVMEWEEWGNPAIPEQYEWMRSYSPYDNVTATDYPAMLVTAGLNDPRVAYWEPAKWVAKLRSTATFRGPLLLKTEMGAGHGGPSGRYDAWKEEALIYSFLLDQIT
ncbi:MAG: S9 family peptidase [Acidimicrobiia bacterium]|nr:S9 family peptidase [Acidimicrobiia bacterium]